MSKEKDKEGMRILSKDELIKALDEKGIEYDRNQITDAYFPLEDVKVCLESERMPRFGLKMKDLANHRPCPLMWETFGRIKMVLV